MPLQRAKKPFTVLELGLYSIIALGILLAISQFAYNRSLWLDEGRLALNIIDRNLLELAEPLDGNQIAPIGFLAIERLLVILLGKNEFALRLFPLLSFLASTYLLYALALRLTHCRLVSLIATAIFSVSIQHIYFSSEIKQYSSDVMIALAIVLCTNSLKFGNYSGSLKDRIVA